MIERLCLIGVGLIGGSLALALRRAGYCRHVVGVGRGTANLEDALRLKIIDEVSHNPATAVQGADMIVLAVPVGSVEAVCRRIAVPMDPDAILTDVGSVKGDVVRQVERAFDRLPPRFVPGHPIAGTERSGASAAFPELFEGRRVLLTPLAATDRDAVERVRRMWEVSGAVVEEIAVDTHDRLLAATSHLPHMLAFGLVDSLARLEDSQRIFRYAAGGFRDFTRIASSDPVMWRDICLHNRDAVLEALTRYQGDLDLLRRAIESRDGDALLAIFERAKQARDRFLH
ncbi:MAG: prephenate dehydrogenase [Thiotrichales bacterium]